MHLTVSLLLLIVLHVRMATCMAFGLYACWLLGTSITSALLCVKCEVTASHQWYIPSGPHTYSDYFFLKVNYIEINYTSTR